ncbi:hypothetical protein CHISP_0720 [Chitinispirillum alkaliphilum]|nr:hypothetical protein CHISP_0720 [Chitinispirillum alkaliphilum]
MMSYSLLQKKLSFIALGYLFLNNIGFCYTRIKYLVKDFLMFLLLKGYCFAILRSSS